MKPYTYLLINFFTILVPFLFSFEHRITYYKNWPALIKSICITGAFFIIWDHLLTRLGVWGFNPEYLIGLYIWGLPLEEWLFFVTVPYSCVFIYESVNFLSKNDPFKKQAQNISLALIVVLSVIVLLNYSKLYTATKLSLTILMLIWVYFRKIEWLGKFYRAYLISLIPFLVVNGLLTALPVVVYNDNENLGIRIGTIPVEDTIYTLLLLLMNITLFEFFRKKNVTISQLKSQGNN